MCQESAMRMNFHERCVYGDVPYHDLFGLQGGDENSPRLLKCGMGRGRLGVSLKARIASNSLQAAMNGAFKKMGEGAVM